MGGTGTTGHAAIPEEDDEDGEVDESGVEAKVMRSWCKLGDFEIMKGDLVGGGRGSNMNLFIISFDLKICQFIN